MRMKRELAAFKHYVLLNMHRSLLQAFPSSPPSLAPSNRESLEQANYTGVDG